jgi:hypothetical protein
MDTPRMRPRLGPELVEEDSSVVVTDVVMTYALGISMAEERSLVASAADG